MLGSGEGVPRADMFQRSRRFKRCLWGCRRRAQDDDRVRPVKQMSNLAGMAGDFVENGRDAEFQCRRVGMG